MRTRKAFISLGVFWVGGLALGTPTPTPACYPGYGSTKRMGGAGEDCGYGIARDEDGNVFITGRFRNAVNFAADWGGSDVKTAVPAYFDDIFVTKVNADGTYGWTRRMGGSGWDSGGGIATDGAGNVFVTGSFQSVVNFAEDWAGSDSKTCAGMFDIFLTMLSPTLPGPDLLG